MLGTTQYFRVTAVSGCLADVLRADVNPLFMSIPGEGIHFYLRLKTGSVSVQRHLSSSSGANQQLQGHPRKGHGSQLSLHSEPQLVLTPYKSGVPALMFTNRLH